MIAASERALKGRWTTYVLSNHDIPRHYDRLGDGKHNDEIAKLTATMLLTLRGTPFLYYGEEIGMVTTEPKTVEEVRDPVGRRYWPLRKGATASARRCSGTRPSTRASPPARRGSPSRRRRARRTSPRKSATLRRSLISTSASSRCAAAAPRSSTAATRRSATTRTSTPTAAACAAQTAIVALNMSGERRTFKLPPTTRTGPFVYSVALSSRPAPEHSRGVSGELSLAPFEAVILAARTP